MRFYLTQRSGNKHLQNVDTNEFASIPANSPQNLSPRRFGHAESESEVEVLGILHPNARNEGKPSKKKFSGLPIMYLIVSSLVKTPSLSIEIIIPE